MSVRRGSLALGTTVEMWMNAGIPECANQAGVSIYREGTSACVPQGTPRVWTGSIVTTRERALVTRSCWEADVLLPTSTE